MKKIFIFLLESAMLFLIACEDGNQVDMNIDSVIYIVNSDLQEVSLSDSVSTYELWVYKGGYNDDEITVTLNVDEDVLNTYNEENSTSYQLLPSSCYSFDSNTITLGKSKDSDYSNYTTITFDSLSTLSTNSSYVLPVSIECDSGDSISEDKSSVLLEIETE